VTFEDRLVAEFPNVRISRTETSTMAHIGRKSYAILVKSWEPWDEVEQESILQMIRDDPTRRY